MDTSKNIKNTIKVEFDLLDENFLNKLGTRIYKRKGKKLFMEFYSYENALDYAIKNFMYVDISSPSELSIDIEKRKNNLMEML